MTTELEEDGFISLYPRLCQRFEGLLKHTTLEGNDHFVFWWGHWIGCWRGTGGDSELELKPRRKSARVQDHAPSPSSHAIPPVTCPKSPQARCPAAYVFWTSTSDWTYTGLAVGDRGLAASNSRLRASTGAHSESAQEHARPASKQAVVLCTHRRLPIPSPGPSLRRLVIPSPALPWARCPPPGADTIHGEGSGRKRCGRIDGTGGREGGRWPEGAVLRRGGGSRRYPVRGWHGRADVRGRAGRAWDWGRREGGPSCGGEGDGMGGTAEVLCEACACLSMAETAVRCQSETTRGVSLMSTCLSMADTPTDTVDMRVGWQVEARKDAA
ncbi:hypothetical protein IW261DRAFT_1415405 [Armillaria novae-zelandiae]|uniref:Uncharacterized protein n=1 Tax=Armillaria novae-zelandiae TaxID=153914 RepID=A0AA39UPY5_9AGAR|nr:hypothetical protein IW261DRAFT_1415405 [Armillaria novae-zelandiae]